MGRALLHAAHRGGLVRWRVIPVKGAAAVAALSSGGSGGREGPTMQIDAAIGALVLVGRLLPTSRSERRAFLAARIAAGIAAVWVGDRELARAVAPEAPAHPLAGRGCPAMLRDP